MEPGFSKGFALMTGTIFWGALYGNGEWDFFSFNRGISPTIWGYIYIYIYVYIILYNGDFMEYHNPQFLV